ncbi:MAG: histidinol-phosphatase HisJ family protein [Eubacterium sp.]|nr:histidinol-phosphatase HisJ family protein [Eubacterium sp.]
MIPDYHLHTEFSGDCETPVTELIKTAANMGLSSVCITDHNDLDFPDTPDNVDFDLDIETYISSLTLLRERLKNDAAYRASLGIKAFDLRIGLEQGVMPSTCDRLEDYSKKHPGLDFIICSSHVVDDMDPYYPEYFEGKNEKDAYRHYFETILYNVEHFNDYNVYGHIDYILRYGPTKADNFKVKEYLEILEPAFKKMIYNGKGIEINTGSLYRELDFMHPHDDILRLYKELGGEIITVGSDAHDLAHIGYGFKDAEKRLLNFGFRYYCTFRNMKPDFIPIELQL